MDEEPEPEIRANESLPDLNLQPDLDLSDLFPAESGQVDEVVEDDANDEPTDESSPNDDIYLDDGTTLPEKVESPGVVYEGQIDDDVIVSDDDEALETFSADELAEMKSMLE